MDKEVVVIVITHPSTWREEVARNNCLLLPTFEPNWGCFLESIAICGIAGKKCNLVGKDNVWHMSVTDVKPSLLILDEVTESLDKMITHSLLELLESLLAALLSISRDDYFYYSYPAT